MYSVIARVTLEMRQCAITWTPEAIFPFEFGNTGS